MKKTVVSLIIVLLTSSISFAQQKIQQPVPQISNHDLALQYLNKSRSQKKISAVIGISGTTILITGLIISMAGFSKEFDFTHPDKGSSAMAAGSAIAIGGTVMLAGGIAFALASKQNKKKAELLLRSEKARPATSFIPGRVYSIGVAISF